MDADRLAEKAREYELNAKAAADRPTAEDRRAALVFSTVALVLYELALLDDDGVERSRVRYRTIVADPPWEYDAFVSLWPNRTKKAKRTLPYASMSLWEIGELPISELAHEDGCNLFLWTTNRYLPHAFPLLAHWGFDYRQTITWAKTNPTPWSGSVAPHSTEFLLLACRGAVGFQGRVVASVITHRRMEHSQKPDVFLDFVEQVSPGPYLELFARRQRLGWDTWGDEALHHIELA